MERSRRPGLARGPAGWALLGIILALALVSSTACGTRPAPGRSTPSYSFTSHRAPSGAPYGSRAASRALARKMLGQLRRPPGSRVVRPHPEPRYLRQPAQGLGAIHRVDVKRFYTAPRSRHASYTYLLRHVPRGYRLVGSGYLGQGSTKVMEFVSYAPKSLPRGIDEASLVVGAVPGRHGGSVLRADGLVAWFPRRSAAELLHPADYRAVTIARINQSARHRTVRTLRSRAAITRLARLLNSLPASDGGSVNGCPPDAPVYDLAFRPTAGHPRFLVSSFGCSTDTVTVGGRRQPALSDPGNHLSAAARRLLHHRAG